MTEKTLSAIVGICLLLIPYISIAQFTYELDKTTRFEKMGVADGLSTEFTTCIHQDKYGYIWVGTQFGLNLFDGYEFKTFNPSYGDTNSLNYGHIYCIYEEDDGTMWFGTHQGMSKYNRANHTFSNYLPVPTHPDSVANIVQNLVSDREYLWVDVSWGLYRFHKKTGEFTSYGKNTAKLEKGIHEQGSEVILMDRSGVIWVTSNDNHGRIALNRYNWETETFTHFPIDTIDTNRWNGIRSLSIVEDSNNNIWLASSGGGLIKLVDKEKGKFRLFIHDDKDTNSIINNYIYTLFEDSKGRLWAGGLTGFSLINVETEQFTNFPIPLRYDHSGWVNEITGIYEDNNGNLWLTSLEGIFRFNPITSRLQHFIHDSENPEGLNDNFMADILVDQTDQVWVASWNNGLNKFNPFTNAFKRIQKKGHPDISLKSNYVRNFLVDHKNNLWIGSTDGTSGLSRTKFKNNHDFGIFDHFVFDAENPGSISGNYINDIYEDKTKTVWFATFSGLNSYSYATNTFERFQFNADDNTSLRSNSVEAIFEDSHGTFWVGTRDFLNIMDRETGQFFRHSSTANNELSANYKTNDTRVIFQDSHGKLWFAGNNLRSFVREDSSFIKYTFKSENSSANMLKPFRDIKEDDSANLWMANLHHGIIKFNRADSSFSSINTAHGLPDNRVTSIEIDENGYIWFSSKGISRLDPRDLSIKNFDQADGLLHPEIICSFKDKNGWLFFGGRKGFNVFHPDSLKENTFIPPVYITSLTVAGEQKYFDQPLYEMDDIELNYNENDITFDFVALNYINPNNNQYAFMLEGYDDDWNYVGNRRTAFYTNLNPGKYKFRVKGSNNDGYWNEEGASLAVVIHPPFWATWWAYGIYIFMLLGALYLVRRNEINKLISKQRIRQLEDEKNLLEAQSVIIGQENERKRIAQELHDGIGVLISTAKIHFSKVMKNITDQKTRDLVKKADRLLMDAGEEVRGISHNMMPGVLSQFGLNQAIDSLFEEVSETGKLEVRIDLSAIEKRLPENTEIMLFRIVQELVNNTIKYADASQVTFITQKHDGYLHLRYSDNGKGFNETEIPQGKNFGLNGIRSRTNFLNGKFEINTKKGQGFSSLISIPLN